VRHLLLHADGETSHHGKLGQRVTIPLARIEDLAAVRPSADARIRAHLAEHPEAVDRYTGRPRRVALVSDASALPEGTDPAAALVGMESAAAFLHHHSGLDITPLPVDARRASLADTVAALSPGFAGVCLHDTSAEHADAVRRRLHPVQPDLPILDTGDDAAAVTMVAALLNAARQANTSLQDSRILIIDAHTAPTIGALLIAAGARDLSLADTMPAPAAVPDDGPLPHHVLIDLSAADAVPPYWGHHAETPYIALTGSSTARRPQPTAIVVTGRPGPHQLHPLLALPGLLSAAVHRRISVDVTSRLAAAHASPASPRPVACFPTPSTRASPPPSTPR
jgi:malic enzyme